MRRTRGATVTGECIAEIARASGQVPKTAVFQYAYFNYERNVFVCVFDDKSFDVVPEGCSFPIDVDAERG